MAASVNGSEITYLQLNHLLRSNGLDSSDQKIVRKSLDALIDQEVLYQQGVQAKLDRDPEILQAMEMARRQILVEAYSRRFIYPQSAISESDAQSYYNANPDLFQRRRLYTLQIFSLDGEHDAGALLADMSEHVSPDAMRARLKEKRLVFGEKNTEITSQSVPLDMLSHFSKANVGDVLTTRVGGGTQLIVVEKIVDAPLSLAQATPDIKGFLRSTRDREAMRTRLTQLRQGAQIAYRGQFAEADQPAAERATLSQTH